VIVGRRARQVAGAFQTNVLGAQHQKGRGEEQTQQRLAQREAHLVREERQKELNFVERDRANVRERQRQRANGHWRRNREQKTWQKTKLLKE
jgi:hypothetical protein